MKNILQIAAIVLVASVIGGVVASLVGNQSAELGASGTRFPNGISADSTSPSAGEVRGTTLTGTGAFNGPIQSISATTDTLTSADLGSTVLLTSASGTTVTLPAATSGAFFRFIIATAYDTANMIIDSAEGDNIEGALIVAGAVVDCDAEDQLNFVADGENLGDYVEIVSDGTKWYIVDSGVLTTAKLTCTDPS